MRTMLDKTDGLSQRVQLYYKYPPQPKPRTIVQQATITTTKSTFPSSLCFSTTPRSLNNTYSAIDHQHSTSRPIAIHLPRNSMPAARAVKALLQPYHSIAIKARYDSFQQNTPRHIFSWLADAREDVNWERGFGVRDLTVLLKRVI